MEPKKVGRTLGIVVRVASNMLRERMDRAAAAPATPVTSSIPAPVSARTSSAGQRKTASRVATAKRGAKAFGQALWGPFTHAGSVLWLEITGLFFALFALFFVQSVYRVRTSWRQGPEHLHLMLYCVLGLSFVWFSTSSFMRAYRKSKRGPGGSAQT